MYNPHSWQPKNAGPLQELIKRSELIVNNDIDFFICVSIQGISIIDLSFYYFEVSFLQVWEIHKDYPSLSNHELILLT